MFHLSRRSWLKSAGVPDTTAAAWPLFRQMAMASDKSSHIDIGSRRELFVDRDLIDKLDGARLKLHQPRPAAKVIDFDKP